MTLSPSSPCQTDEVACVDDSVAHCDQGHFVLTKCPVGLAYAVFVHLARSDAHDIPGVEHLPKWTPPGTLSAV